MESVAWFVRFTVERLVNEFFQDKFLAEKMEGKLHYAMLA
jgi:hypothetical protein